MPNVTQTQGVGNTRNNDHSRSTAQGKIDCLSTPGAWTTTTEPQDDHTNSAGNILYGAANGDFSLTNSLAILLDWATQAAMETTTEVAMGPAIKATVGTGSEASHMLSKQDTIPRNTIEHIVDRLANVKKHMNEFRAFISTQKDLDQPLYNWRKYGNYPALGTAVSELQESTARFKRTRLPQDRLTASVARATDYSTSVSRAAVDILAIINKNIADYMDEMETSTFGEEAKAQANALITEDVRKLVEHSTRAAEHVWRATDLLRVCKEKRNRDKDWAWSAAATAMTAFIAAAVGIAAAHLYGPSGSGLASSASHSMNTQMLDLVERTQAVTNLTSEIYNIKLKDIDQRYTNLASLSESHGIRIDNIVDALGPPNAEGTYYGSMPMQETKDDGTCESRVQKVSAELNFQTRRQQENLEQMRKDMNRMGIRLTQSVEQLKKKKKKKK